MSEKILTFACVVAFIYSTSAARAPFITKCSSSDPKCAKNSGQAAIPRFAAGFPELGIETMDPLHYDKIDASTSDLKLILSDIDIIGLKTCKLTKLVRDVARSKILISGLCNLGLEGQYEVGGNILFLPIRGKGAAHVKLNKLYIEVDADMADKVKDGKKYWDVKSWTHKYELQEKAELDLENLFEGNEVLGRAARELLRSSPNEVIGEVGPPIVKAILTKLIKNVDKFFHKVPAEELALD
ncbi:uncharacterized protein LOC113229645 [Hyposmocoma kahamanoa]|uniref:uncharacterized protein LOC113229645 n=1 Tax=Hyposmocoma kahamanoa TaxID=1477025 RepID=UPI000E6D5B0D|nr:uncharacterized protein LOC113229645 [Hyposmocoma kahamanoa]